MDIKNIEVFNFEGAIRGMRNPKKSWDKSDSKWQLIPNGTPFRSHDEWQYILGENDLKLAIKLSRAGSPHDKYLRQIFVCMDINAPLFWWKEMDQYRVGVTTDSESTMHTISSEQITIERFERNTYDPDLIIEEAQEVQRMCVEEEEPINWGVGIIISFLEKLRKRYLRTKDVRYWRELIRWLPESWLQMRTWTADYAVLKAIYKDRRDHKLNEWHIFTDIIKSLPYSELITLEE